MWCRRQPAASISISHLLQFTRTLYAFGSGIVPVEGAVAPKAKSPAPSIQLPLDLGAKIKKSIGGINSPDVFYV